MLYFALALFFSISIFVLFKYFEKYEINNLMAISISYIISATLAIGISFDIIQFQNLLNYHLLQALMLGVSFFFGFLVMSSSIQKSGMAISSVAANISVIIPVFIAYIYYNERISTMQIIGIGITIPAIYLFFKPKNKVALSISAFVFPLFLFLISGANNSLMRHAERLGVNDYPLLFIGLLFSISFIVSVVFMGATRQFKKIELKNISSGVLLGILNFGGTYFFLKSLTEFHSSLFFAIYNLSFIAISAAIGILYFKEKFSLMNIIGLIIAVGAVVLMNI
ncbi:MAG: DMT family transporter [Bacteroidales bacterium]|nr:DMT family transporter [Bacteroidales bacterium]